MIMREFFAFVHKEFLHILRDKRTLLVVIGIPIALITLFGFALSVEIRNINIGILAPQNEETIDRLTRKIDASEYFTVTSRLSSTDDIDRIMRKGEIDIALIFESNFTSGIFSPEGSNVTIVVDASNPATASSEVMYLMGIVQSYFRDEMQSFSHTAAPPPDIQMPGNSQGTASPLVSAGITPNIRMLYNPQLKSSYNFVPGIMGMILILICALMTSVSIVREKETGTMEILLVSPVKPTTIIIAKIIPYLAICAIVLTIIFLLAYTLLQVPIVGSLFWLIFISMLYVTLALAIGILVSTLVKTQIAAILVSAVLFMLPIIMFSGMIFPIESMPRIFQMVSEIIPAKWYISAMRKVMIEGLQVQYVIKEIGVLAVMTVAILTVALKKFNDKLE